MRRVVVLGSGGSGKSTFARRLGVLTGLHVIHLDSEYWRPNWEKTRREEWVAKVAGLLKRDSWIMDGNFGATRELRMRAADTIIFLDLPRHICMCRVLKRWIRNRGKTRPDMAEGCAEKIDIEFLSWVWNYPNTSRVRAFDEMSRMPDKRIIILKSPREVEELLDNIHAHQER